MYHKNLSGSVVLTLIFENGVKTFIEWAKCHRRHMDRDKIRCPCRKCKNTKLRTSDDVSYHLYMRGFMLKYYNWTSHDEQRVQEYFDVVTTLPLVVAGRGDLVPAFGVLGEPRIPDTITEE
ncbi:UNVERIFIED_CONTAM: hypothetical protein Sindi_1728100 [Sesamum indicum]